MFTPKAAGSSLLAGRRPGSRSNTPLSGNKRGSHHLLGISRGGQGVGTTPVARSNVIENTGSHILATLGGSLPVLVTEVLTMVNTGEVSVTLSENGWAWLVSGRRLVVWRYNGVGRAQCRELSLPPSDLKHRSDLCAVYSVTAGQTPCCIVVSPEGVVRYWTSIVHEGSSTDISAELGGQECMSLLQLQPTGCILATTTGTLVLLHHTNQGISCKHLQPSSNLLGGIGRRVSSLLWGSITGGHGSEVKLIRGLSLPAQSTESLSNKTSAMILTSASLQKWIVEEGDMARQLYEVDLSEMIKDCMWNVLAEQGQEGKAAWLRIWQMDMSALDSDRIAVLVSGINTNDSLSQTEATKFRVFYGLLILKVKSDVPPFDAEAFKLLPESCIINEGEEPRPFKIIAVKDTVYILNDEDIHPVNIFQDTQAPKVSLGPGNSILGVGRCQDSALLFTPNHGVVTLAPAQKDNRMDVTATPETSFMMDKSLKLSDTLNISVSAQGLENLTMSESKGDQLKAAFLLYCKRCMGQAQSMVEELFPASNQPEAVDSALDRLVLSLSRDLIDDFPASDPRWMESLPASQVAGTGSTMSLLVLHQLEDKLTCHQLFLAFLKNVGLWSRLNAVSGKSGNSPISSVLALAEHNEKIVAAITLRTIHIDFAKMVDTCIKACLDDRDITAGGNLTAQDHFYREISRIDELLESAVLNLQHCVRVERQYELVESIISINTVIITVIRAVLAHRNKNVHDFDPTGPATKLEYLPWTTVKRNQLMSLFNLTIKHVVKNAEQDTDRMKIYAQIMDLADIVLDGYRSEVDSLDGERKNEAVQQFNRTKDQLIGSLIDLKLYDQATSLGEKYLNFNGLVRICEETGNDSKLEEYTKQYANQNFSEVVFSWYMKQGKQSRLLSAPNDRSKELSRFLSGHSDISWLHDINTGNMAKASGTLAQIASNETDIFERKKLQLSLAKLAALAADDDDKESLVQQLDADMVLQNAQENIPGRVLEAFGMEKDGMRVLTPREMIEMYIGEENVQADSLDFVKALCLLDYIQLDQEELEKVRLHIWCQSILKDSWSEIDVNNPINSVQETVFFKVIEYGFHQGYDLDTFLPAPENILQQDELGELKDQTNFKYLLQTGYEHVQRVCAAAS